MNKNKISKLNIIQLSRHIMDLLFIQSGDGAHIKEPKLRNVWHMFAFTIAGYWLCSVMPLPLLNSIFPGNQQIIFGWRLFSVLIFIFLLLLLVILAFRHYKFLLLTGKDLKFRSIVFFYLFAIVLYGHLYSCLYFLIPSLFNMVNPIIIPSKYMLQFGFKPFLLKYDFFIYSAYIITTQEYSRIQSTSIIVSLINIMEIFFGVVIITLFIATFVQKTIKVNTK